MKLEDSSAFCFNFSDLLWLVLSFAEQVGNLSRQ